MKTQNHHLPTIAAVGVAFVLSFVAAGFAFPAQGQAPAQVQAASAGMAYVGGQDQAVATVAGAAQTGVGITLYQAMRHLQTFGPQGTCTSLVVQQEEANETAGQPDPDDVVGIAASSGIGIPVYAADNYVQNFGQAVTTVCPAGYP